MFAPIIIGASGAATPFPPGDPGIDLATASTGDYFRKSAGGVLEARTPVQVASDIGQGWTMVSKSANEARNTNTTLADDGALVFSMAASTKYRIRCRVWYDTAATPDFKYAIAGPASPTLVRIERRSCIAGGTPANVTGLDQAAVGSTALAGAGTVAGLVSFEAIWHNGSNAGTFSFQWAQNTSNGSDTTVLAGSYLEYQIA